MSIAVYTLLRARQLTEQQNAPTRRYECTRTRPTHTHDSLGLSHHRVRNLSYKRTSIY